MSAAAETNVAAATRAWGQAAPEWVVVLAQACDASSQVQVGKRLGVSGSLVNQIVHNRYSAGLDRIEQRVRGELMAETVDCPVLGEISTRRCLDEQQRPFASTNPLRVQLYRACRSCEHCRAAQEGR
jgi:hypothetical protein